MIRLLTEEKISEFSAFCENRTVGAVIYTRFLTYGLDSNEVLFWYSETENGATTAVFSMTDVILLVCTDDTANEDEIMLFADTVGASEVTYGTAEFTLEFTDTKKEYTADDISGENIKEVFDVVFAEDNNRKLYFEKWYTDASHKIRHGLIHGKCIYKDGKCVSVALTSGETDNTAVISSVATLKEYRNQGLGERVVLSLAQSLDKNVYLMTDNEKTKSWYENIGFKSI